jgi:hypothetical protein
MLGMILTLRYRTEFSVLILYCFMYMCVYVEALKWKNSNYRNGNFIEVEPS